MNRSCRLLLLTLVLLGAPARAAVIVNGPWLEDVHPGGITVVWEMDELLPADGPDAPRVELGTDTDYGRSVVATGSLVQATWPVYRAVVSGLPPSTEQHYRVVGGGASSAAATFRTAPLPGTTGFRFYVLGDSRSRPEVFARIADRVHADLLERPERNQTFALSVGDIVYHGSNHDEFGEQWFGPAAPLLARVPVLIAFGNHEDRNDAQRSDPLLRGWFRNGGPKWNALTFGAVHVSALALWDAAGFVSGPQPDWLEQTLAASAADPSVRWRFAALHELPWSVGGHGPDEAPAPALRAQVHPRLRDAGVVAAFGGHNHLYARYEPIDGVHYLTTGSSGTPVDTRSWSAWAGGVLARHATVPHWAAVDVEPESLTIRVFDEAGAVLDAVTIGDDPADRPPVADGGPDVCLPVGGSVRLEATASVDPEGTPLRFDWTQVDGPAPAVFHDTSSPSPKVALPQPGRYVFALRVSDGALDSAPDHVVARVGAGFVAEPTVGLGGAEGATPAYACAELSRASAVPVGGPFELQCGAGALAASSSGSGGSAAALALAAGLVLVVCAARRRARRRSG